MHTCLATTTTIAGLWVPWRVACFCRWRRALGSVGWLVLWFAFFVSSLSSVCASRAGHPPGSAASHLRRQAARGWPHSLGLQHPKRIHLAPRESCFLHRAVDTLKRLLLRIPLTISELLLLDNLKVAAEARFVTFHDVLAGTLNKTASSKGGGSSIPNVW